MTYGRGEKKNMTRVNVIYDIEQEYLFEETNGEYEIKSYKDKGKNVKISNKDLMEPKKKKN